MHCCDCSSIVADGHLSILCKFLSPANPTRPKYSSSLDIRHVNFKAHVYKGQVVAAATGVGSFVLTLMLALASICPNHISRFFRYSPIHMLRFLNALCEASTTLSFTNSMIYSWWDASLYNIPSLCWRARTSAWRLRSSCSLRSYLLWHSLACTCVWCWVTRLSNKLSRFYPKSLRERVRE